MKEEKHLQIKRIAAHINIPFTVGGGINELKDVDRLLNAGADKVSINSAAIRNPMLVDEIAKHFGSQVCVVAIDARQTANGWKCYLNGGRVETERYLYEWAKEVNDEWAKEVNDRGAGEILFTSMDHDGVKTGYANEALAHLSETLDIPVIASGGAGKMEHFRDAFTLGKADAALAGKRFPLWRDTYNETERISSQRRYLSKNLNTYIIIGKRILKLWN